MAKVHILPPEIVSKIAAGEVVERPASVLKELIENSIDAEATLIEVTLKDAGKTLIRIKDNGAGIAEDDLNTILVHRHATSKISSLDNLCQIMSLGFRGEALYSVSAISDITLRSKTKNAAHGWELHLRGNEKLSQKPATMHTGTEIEVKELFFNTPARKKFLKSQSSEMNALLDVFIPYTLLYPRLRFSLIHDKRTILDLPQTDNLIERIAGALHLETKHIIEEKRNFSREDLSLHLVLGDINIRRSRRDMQFIFINSRPVQNKNISFHLNNIYRLLFSRGVYPFFCAYITMPASELDVNVHPTKREIRIKNETELVAKMRGFAEQLLMARSKARQFEESIFSMPQPSSNQPQVPYSYETANFAQLKASLRQQPSLSIEEDTLLFKTTSLPAQKDKTLKEKLKESSYIGNLLNKYLLFEAKGSLLIVDQHAAHERNNFERLKNQIEKGAVEIQQLLAPILIKLSYQEMLAWEENKEVFEKMGFSASLFDKETLAIHGYPQLIAQPENSLRHLLAGESISKVDTSTLARLACRSSVTTGYSLSKEEAEYQRSQLLLCQAPFTCPHGRPTVIEITDDSLSKQFLRK